MSPETAQRLDRIAHRMMQGIAFIGTATLITIMVAAWVIALGTHQDIILWD